MRQVALQPAVHPDTTHGATELAAGARQALITAVPLLQSTMLSTWPELH